MSPYNYPFTPQLTRPNKEVGLTRVVTVPLHRMEQNLIMKNFQYNCETEEYL
jgi:hypothetical protein